MKKSKIFITLFILVTVVTTAVGREIKATRIKSAIYTDGRITESEWPESLFQKGFTQMEPDKGQPSLEMTMVAVQYDDHYIYVAFICNKSYPDPVTAEQTRRDQFERKDDLVSITLDTYHDSRSAYWFMINPLNTQVDARISDDGKTVDTELDAEWDAKAAITDSGWTAEFSIPYRSIRYNPKLSEWGINFSRFIPRKLETSYWSGIMENDFRVSQYGTLTGLVFPESRSELHLIPYTTLRYETFSQDKWNWEIGLDAEYRFQNNITGNLTLNPDFAIVEGDKERINMTRWELSFPEKRKFFLEGSDMFRNRIRAFYSRRIGEIDFGGKVIGKTGPYAFSVIGVRARAVEDNIHTSEDEAFPAYNTAIVRIKRDVLKSSTLGMMIINREWKGGFNRVFSLDGVFNFKREYLLTTQFVVAAPGPLKQNYGGFIRLARENNIYHVHLRYTELAEQFRESVNDVGYIRDDDRRELDSAVSYKWWVKRFGIEFLDYDSNYNIYWSMTSGILRSWEIVQELDCYFKNKFSVSVQYVRDYQLFEKGYKNYSTEIELGYNTQEWSSSKLEYECGVNFDRNFWMVTGSNNIKIHDKFSLEYELRRLCFDPDPEQESTWLSITTLNYQFTPDLFIRLFTQYRSVTERFYIYGLFGWRFKLPNSALYFVYTRDDFKRIGLLREKDEIFFLKFAYDFTL